MGDLQKGITFRGHDESKESSNKGNFLELMNLLGEYSHELREFLDKERIIYASHEPQNQLIQCIFEEVKDEIRRRVKNSRYISLMMDDTSDFSNTEQSAISVRLINDGIIEEHLLGFVNASNDQSAAALTNLLLKTLEDYNITPENGKRKL
eukprot:gene2873-3324_t